MLHKAAQGNQPSAIVYFNKKYNMNLESSDNDLLNAFHLASISGMDNSVIYLLSLGIIPNIKDINVNTALHYAVKYSHSLIVKKLLQNGANKNIINKIQKKTSVMLAEDNPEIMEIFRKKEFVKSYSLNLIFPKKLNFQI